MEGKLDAHVHFWKYNKEDFGWIPPQHKKIKKDFLLQDLKPVALAAGYSACIAVQAAQTEAETQFLLDIALDSQFVAGVVGWVDLQATDVAERLAHFAQHPKFKGVRHIIQAETDPKFMQRPAFLNGIEALDAHSLPFDLLVNRLQLAQALKLVKTFPHQKFVLNHMGKPSHNPEDLLQWQRDITYLADSSNVYVKLSGYLPEGPKGTENNKWKANQYMQQYLHFIKFCINAFTISRCMIGSDWPVCLPYASYADTMALVEDNLPNTLLIASRNAKGFYNVNIPEFDLT